MAQKFTKRGDNVPPELIDGEFFTTGSPSQRPYGSAWPQGAYDASGALVRAEKLMTATMLKERFLFGVPLVSPITEQKVSNRMLQDYVKRAMNYFEVDSKTFLQPVMIRQRLPFDPQLYNANMWFEVPQKPILRVKRVAICSASYTDQQGGINTNPHETYDPDSKQPVQPWNPNSGRAPYPTGDQIFQIPNDWVDTSYASHGKIFVNPINPAFSAIGTSSAIAAAGATILTFIGQQGWVPAYWTVEVEVGFCSEDGDVPVFVNEAIGQKAAMLLLDNLIPLYRIANQSLNIDGLGQSVSDMAYQLLANKRELLEKDYTANIKKIKTITANTMFVSNI